MYQQNEDHNFIEADFVDECRRELESMRTIKLDNYTTLRDIIFREPDKMALHVENLDFRRIIESNDFKEKFSIYGFLLQLQFKNGLVRRKLLEPSKMSLKLLSEVKLPDICSENITLYLSNEDLQNVIKAVQREKL